MRVPVTLGVRDMYIAKMQQQEEEEATTTTTTSASASGEKELPCLISANNSLKTNALYNELTALLQ